MFVVVLFFLSIYGFEEIINLLIIMIWLWWFLFKLVNVLKCNGGLWLSVSVSKCFLKVLWRLLRVLYFYWWCIVRRFNEFKCLFILKINFIWNYF